MATKSKTLTPGEILVLPKSAKISSLVLKGSIALSSTCNNLPDPTPTACYVFTWEADATDFEDAYFSQLIIGSIIYNIPDPDGFPSNQYEDGGSEAEKLSQAINLIPDFVGEVIAYDQSNVNSLRQVMIRLPDLGVFPLMKLVEPNPGAGQIMYLEAYKNSTCDIPGGWTEF